MKQSLILRTDVTAVTDRYKGVEESFTLSVTAVMPVYILRI